MSVTQERTVRLCFCQERIVAMGTHVFRYNGVKGAWYFTDAPLRSMSKQAHFRAFIDRAEFDHIDHTGEPMLWHDCPFCGMQLPGTEHVGPVSQGDGGEGRET